MVIDEVDLTIKAGNGGEGIVSFGRMAKSGPNGGNGGDGGDVYVVAKSDLTLLRKFHNGQKVKAENGVFGDRNKKSGKRGEDLVLNFPVGTHFVDEDTLEEFELKTVSEKILLCKGGVGGVGNFELRSSTLTTPKHTIPATKGQIRKLKINLKFIADFGLIGLPSAGKSSLLNELTNANVKIAQYHFTTLSANLGVLPNKMILADIPGLIKGASQGKGLGTRFLKHIQKVSLLLHCIAADSKDHLSDYKTIRKELGKYNRELLKKKEIILITKTDLVNEIKVKDLVKKLEKLKKKIIATSIYDKESLDNLVSILK